MADLLAGPVAADPVGAVAGDAAAVVGALCAGAQQACARWAANTLTRAFLVGIAPHGNTGADARRALQAARAARSPALLVAADAVGAESREALLPVAARLAAGQSAAGQAVADGLAGAGVVGVGARLDSSAAAFLSRQIAALARTPAWRHAADAVHAGAFEAVEIAFAGRARPTATAFIAVAHRRSRALVVGVLAVGYRRAGPLGSCQRARTAKALAGLVATHAVGAMPAEAAPVASALLSAEGRAAALAVADVEPGTVVVRVFAAGDWEAETLGARLDAGVARLGAGTVAADLVDAQTGEALGSDQAWHPLSRTQLTAPSQTVPDGQPARGLSPAGTSEQRPREPSRSQPSQGLEQRRSQQRPWAHTPLKHSSSAAQPPPSGVLQVPKPLQTWPGGQPLSSTVPAGSGRHRPARPGLSQVSHGSEQGLAQQTPPAQCLLRQSTAAVQGAPLRCTQAPAPSQIMVPGQSSSGSMPRGEGEHNPRAVPLRQSRQAS